MTPVSWATTSEIKDQILIKLRYESICFMQLTELNRYKQNISQQKGFCDKDKVYLGSLERQSVIFHNLDFQKNHIENVNQTLKFLIAVFTKIKWQAKDTKEKNNARTIQMFGNYLTLLSKVHSLIVFLSNSAFYVSKHHAYGT